MQNVPTVKTDPEALSIMGQSSFKKIKEKSSISHSKEKSDEWETTFDRKIEFKVKAPDEISTYKRETDKFPVRG
ncbi:MAG: hypothetical protein IC227_05040 [Enterococcus lacertideformus]|uniref:Uncharacterized protein n=1 Tax=Enterococcus lacertideformus TaxID=2771493 RepID=A0A931AZU8_9ENTE|nr:hypothetical protein [Enterococcus lacertideformus]